MVALLAGIVTLHDGAASTLRPLGAPLAFVALAVPLAVMLDEVGIFEELAGRAARSPRVVGACWILAAAVVALLNLDAAVVLLTPLYVRTARRVGLDPVMLAFQPVLLAMLASGVLPVSNLTNLIAASRLSLTSTDFLANLALPSVVASTVGWFAYRRVFPARASRGRPADPVDRRALAGRRERDRAVPRAAGRRRARRRSRVGGRRSSTIGFLVRVHAARCRGAGCPSARSCSPARSRSSPRAWPPPSRTCLASAGDGGVRGFGTGVVVGQRAQQPARHARDAAARRAHGARVWPLLFGLNAGPSLVITGSLAGLLWQASARASGVHVTAGQYSRVGAIVGVPAMVAGMRRAPPALTDRVRPRTAMSQVGAPSARQCGVHAAAACFDLHVPESRSLKTKRAAIRPIVDGLRHRFPVSVAEVDHQDQWQRAAIGVAVVGSSDTQVREVLASVERFVVAARRRRAARRRDRVAGAAVSPQRKYPRTARVNEVMLEVLADELERMSRSAPRAGHAHRRRRDPRPRLRDGLLLDARAPRPPRPPASFGRDAGDALRAAAPHLRGLVGRQMRIRQVPQLTFELDPGIVAGQRIEEILRGIHHDDGAAGRG